MSKMEKNQEGQALLFVIVALTVALAVGVSTAFRTLSSVSRVTTTDTSVRVLAAAEGGLEHFLSYSTSELATAVNTCDSLDTPDTDCIVEFTPIDTDSITARAIVMVEEFRGDPDDSYRFRTHVNQGEAITLNLAGYNNTPGFIDVCWLGNSDIFFTYFDGPTISNWTLSDDVSGQGVLCPLGNCFSGSSHVQNTVDAFAPESCLALGPSYHGYRFNLRASTTNVTLERGLSLIPLNSGVSLVAKNPSDPGTFPQLLGYRITSRGELLEDATVKTTKTVTVTRSLPYLSANLLFGLFADGGISTESSYMEPKACQTCACEGTGYEKISCGGGIVYVDCATDKCWTPTASKAYNWSSAMDYCSNLSYAGYDDWVLPYDTTLLDLCNSSLCSGSGPCFGDDGVGTHYWSSRVFGSGISYYVNFNPCQRNWVADTIAKYVRCTR